jgi:S-adenosylmethionine synthetase
MRLTLSSAPRQAPPGSNGRYDAIIIGAGLSGVTAAALCEQAAQSIIQEVPGIRAVTVHVLSQIGRRVDEPQVCAALVHPEGRELRLAIKDAIAEVLDSRLVRVSEVGQAIRDQKLRFF